MRSRKKSACKASVAFIPSNVDKDATGSKGWVAGMSRGIKLGTWRARRHCRALLLWIESCPGAGLKKDSAETKEDAGENTATNSSLEDTENRVSTSFPKINACSGEGQVNRRVKKRGERYDTARWAGGFVGASLLMQGRNTRSGTAGSAATRETWISVSPFSAR